MTQDCIPSSYSYVWQTDLTTAIEDMARAGFEETELMAALPHIDLWSRGDVLAEEIRAACASSGLRIAGLNPPGLDINIGSPDASVREWSVDMYTAIGRLAAEVGAWYLVVHPGRRHVLVPAPEEAARQWVLEGVGQIAGALESTGIRVLFENTPTGLLDTAEQCVSVIRDVDASNVGMVYDVANGFMVEDPEQGLRRAADVVELVQVSDTTTARWLHDPIGTGEVDFNALAATTADISFDGGVVIETVHRQDIAAGLQRDRARLAVAGWNLRGAHP